MSDSSTTPLKSTPGWAELCAMVAVVPPLWVWRGFVLATIWNWFAWPFTPVQLTIPLAVGALCLVDQFTGNWRSKDEPRRRDYWSHIGGGLALSALMLLTAAVAHHFVAHP